MATILVADDRPMNRQYLVALLSYFNHRLLEANDGEEALRLARAEHPHLIISDLVMPRLDGEELALRLKADPQVAHIPILFYSANYSTQQAAAIASTVSAFGVLPKPCEPEVILETVHKALGVPIPTPSQAPHPPGNQASVVAKLPSELSALEAISYRLATLIEMSLELAAERDPDALLEGSAHMARKLITARYAMVGVLGEDGKTTRRFFSSSGSGSNGPGGGSDRGGTTETGAEPRAAPPRGSVLGRVVEDRRPLRLRNVNIGEFGVALPMAAPDRSRPASLLAVPLQSPSRLQGWLCLVDKLGAEEFSEEDERVVTTLASQVSIAYEKVDERERADEELRESKARFETLFEAAPDALVATDGQGRITQVNAQVEKLFGYSRNKLTGQTIEVLLPERFREVHRAHRRRYYGEPREPRLRPMGAGLELYGRRKDGSEFPVDIMLGPLETEQGSQVLSVVRDITLRKQGEDHIRELNRQLEGRVRELQVANESLEAFSYSVSHDLRAPLRHIEAFGQLLLTEHVASLNAEHRRLLNIVCSSAQKMRQLIEDLLCFSRLSGQEMRRSEVDMTALARSVVEEVQGHEPERQLEIRTQDLPRALGDRAMLRQVLVNLVSNAFKFTRRQPGAVVEIGGSTEGDEAVYYVRDNGAGFEMKYAKKLFGVFQRLHPDSQFEGTGIGLALVRRIVERHGGRVWAEGRVGEGAAFYLTLPRPVREQVETTG